MQSKLLKENEVGVFALGGLGEVGKNMYCIEYQDELVIIDSGILFPDDQLLGIDYVIPDYTYLVENQEKIKALVITHGHEDHIGALPYILKDVNVPVYGSRLAIGLVETKLKEHGMMGSTTRKSVSAGQKIKLGQFTVEFIRTNHSIADLFSSLRSHNQTGNR